MPSDAQRIDKIIKLIDNGNQNRVLMSHDIHTKHRLVKFYFHYCWFRYQIYSIIYLFTRRVHLVDMDSLI